MIYVTHTITEQQLEQPEQHPLDMQLEHNLATDAHTLIYRNDKLNLA